MGKNHFNGVQTMSEQLEATPKLPQPTLFIVLSPLPDFPLCPWRMYLSGRGGVPFSWLGDGVFPSQPASEGPKADLQRPGPMLDIPLGHLHPQSIPFSIDETGLLPSFEMLWKGWNRNELLLAGPLPLAPILPRGVSQNATCNGPTHIVHQHQQPRDTNVQRVVH